MQSLALSNYGVQEMNYSEMQVTDGGFPPVILAAWAIMATIDCALVAIYATYDSAGKLNHGNQPTSTSGGGW